MTLRLPTLILAALALFVPLIYWPGIFDFTLHPRLLAIQTGLLIGTLFLATNKHAHVAYSPIILPLLAWTAWSILSAFWAINPVESLIQINRTLTFSLLTLFVLSLPKRRPLLDIYTLAGLACIIVSLIGIAQYFGIAFTHLPTVGNPSAIFGYRNFAASYLVICIPFAIGFAVTSQHKHLQIGWGFATAVMAIFLAYTRTRGAWVGLGVSLSIAIAILIVLRFYYAKTIFATTPKHLAISATLIVLIGIGATLPADMKQEGKFRFDERKTDVTTTLASTFSPNDARGRLTVWWHTLEMIRDHPLGGVGIGSWQYAYPLYDKGDWITDKVAPQRPHNDLLWIFSETGLVGISLYLWLLITLAQQVWKHLRTSENTSQTIWVFSIAIGLLALIGHSFFSFPKERIAPSFMFWLGVGAIGLLTSDTARPVKRTSLLALIPLLVFGLVLSYAHLRFDHHYLQTHQTWRKSNWPELIAQSNHALQWGPLNHRLLLLKGLAHQNQGEYQQAIHAYTQAQRYHPNDGHMALGSAYSAISDHKRAVDHYRSESLLYPNQTTPLLELASALLKSGDIPEATASYRQATIISPTLFSAWIGLGNAHQLAAEWKDALAAYHTAQKLDPEHAPLHNNLGAVLKELARFSEAETAYLQALKINPDYARVHHNLGDLYIATNNTAKAIASYQNFIQHWQGDIRFTELAKQKIQNLQKLQ